MYHRHHGEEIFAPPAKLPGIFPSRHFSAVKICVGRTFSPAAEFFLSRKILPTQLVGL